MFKFLRALASATPKALASVEAIEKKSEQLEAAIAVAPAYDEEMLFYDEFSRRYFTSTMADVLRAEYELNKRIAAYGRANLNEFCDLLDVRPIEHGSYLEWTRGVNFKHEKFALDDGLEGYIISMTIEPTLNPHSGD